MLFLKLKLFFHGIVQNIYNQWQHLLKLAIFSWKSPKKIFNLFKVTPSSPWPRMSKKTYSQHFAGKFCTTFISNYFQHITSVHEGSSLHIVNFPTRYHALPSIFKKISSYTSFLRNSKVIRGNSLKMTQICIYFTENVR